MKTDWNPLLRDQFEEPYWRQLQAFVREERAHHEVYPPHDEVFAALHLTPHSDVKVLILGQDPYHGPGQAHGLSFSVREGVAVPPSLRNVFKELGEDLGVPKPRSGNLDGWAAQGVLLLNSVLTVRQATPGSHANSGWEEFTDATIRALDARDERVVFLLWGGYARKKAALVTNPAHVVLEAGHPSPMNPRGFLGSRPFSAANKALADAGLPSVDWERSAG